MEVMELYISVLVFSLGIENILSQIENKNKKKRGKLLRSVCNTTSPDGIIDL